MKYLLDEDEYQQLKSFQRLAILQETEKLQALCTKICNEMPVEYEKPDGFLTDPRPWHCILSLQRTDNLHGYQGGYCDHCPVISICPYKGKKFSK